MSVIPEHFEDILRSKTVAHLATSGPEGKPHVSAIWFSWDGNAIHFSMQAVRQKYRNILREPSVAISIVDPVNPYRAMEIRGQASIREDINYRFIHLLSQKYLDRDATPEEIHAEVKRVVITVKPEQAFVFPPQNDKK